MRILEHFSPQSRKRFNEVMAYVASAFFWALLISDWSMGSSLWRLVFSRKFDYLSLDIFVGVLLGLSLLWLILATLLIILSPVSGPPNVKDERATREFVILSLNLLCGIAISHYLYKNAIDSTAKVLPFLNAAVVIFEARRLFRANLGSDVSAGEMRLLHAALCWLCVLLLIITLNYRGTVYWGEALSIACVAAAIFGFLLPLLLPLEPLGYRLREENYEMLNHYYPQLEKELRNSNSIAASGSPGVIERVLFPNNPRAEIWMEHRGRKLSVIKGALVLDINGREVKVREKDFYHLDRGDKLEIRNVTNDFATYRISIDE